MLRGFFSSLRNRVFLASALVAIAALAFALQFVTTRATRSAEVELRRSLEEAATLVGHTYATRLDTLLTTARLVADLPVLKAAVTTDALTVEPVARDYASLVKAHLMAIANHDGVVLARVGTQKDAGVGEEAVREALLGREDVGFRSGPSGVLAGGHGAHGRALADPRGPRDPQPRPGPRRGAGRRAPGRDGERGGLRLGGPRRRLQPARGRCLDPRRGARRGFPRRGARERQRLRGPGPRTSPPRAAGPVFIVLRSRTERLRFLEPLRTALFAAAGAAVLGAVG